MTAPIQTSPPAGAAQAARTADRPTPQGRPDSEAADHFRDALARKGKDGRTASAGSKQKSEDGSPPTMAPAQTALVPLPFRERPATKGQDGSGAQADQGASAAAPPAATRDVPAPAASAAAPAPDAGQFAALVARLDAGLAPSAQSHLALSGDQWRADQVVIDSQGDGLSVQIDLGHHGDGEQETMQELQARLRARGIAATVDRL